MPPPLGVPAEAGVPASLGGVPGLELGSALCDAARAPAKLELEGAGACTRSPLGARTQGIKQEPARAQARTSPPSAFRVLAPTGVTRSYEQRTLSATAHVHVSNVRAVSKPIRETRTVCCKCRTSSYSELPPGATAAQHLPRCRLALRRTASTPAGVCFPPLGHSEEKIRTKVSRASSRSALAILLAAVSVLCTHPRSSKVGKVGDTTSRAAQRHLNFELSFSFDAR